MELVVGSAQARSVRRAVSVVLAASIWLFAGGGRAAWGETQIAFPRPASLEASIQFWVDVFSGYSYRDFIVVDANDVSRIYQVFHLPGSGPPSRDEVKWINVYLKSKYRDVLERMASAPEPIGVDERRLAAMFKGRPQWVYLYAAQNLRVQQGMRERFREGLLRSRHYRPTMERIFREFGLPVELVTLAQVESGFQRGARSYAGAVGIWQFTRGTGRQFMRITRRHDDRLNPIRETEAAAKLLRYNYQTLGDWPLAITAYNYGTAGTVRAAQSSRNDYDTMLKSYSGPRFGFAVRNYYAEFLAALQVHQNEDKYFPGIQSEASIAPDPLPTSRPAKYRRTRTRQRTARRSARATSRKPGLLQRS